MFRKHFTFMISITIMLLLFIVTGGCEMREKQLEQDNIALKTKDSVVQETQKEIVQEPYKNPYARWENGPSTDPNYFPIGVWLQSPHLAPKYKEAGINVFIGLSTGPTQHQLDILRENGIRVIVKQNIQGLKYIDDPVIMGWMQMDEPDNAQKQEDGSWGPPVDPAVIIERYNEMVANDPTRPVFLNLGETVANEKSKNRGPGADRNDYYGYVKGGDIISFDIYPVSYLGEDYMWYVAKGIDQLYAWADEDKIIWNIIEASNIRSPDRKVTPKQLQSQVWMSLIHGSKGIVYFVHSFYPTTVPSSLLNDPPLLEAVTEVNNRIHSMAPILNSPNKNELVTVTSSKKDVPISYMVKEYEGSIYIFSIGMRNDSTEGSFETVKINEDYEVEVLYEGRTLSAVKGKFTDSFSPYEVHIYKIDKK